MTPDVVAQSFYTLPPCRMVDTRNADAPALQPGATRDFVLVGPCGMPSTAKAISINVTIVQAMAGGDLQLFPAGMSSSPTSTINYEPGQTRANNAVVLLGASGVISVKCEASGTVHLIIDVNGYFQ